MIHRARIDLVLLGSVLFLVIYGLVMISSASAIISYENFGRTDYYIWQQLGSIGVAGLALLFFVLVDYRLWWRLALPIGLGTVILLSLVFVPGIGSDSGTGSFSWIHVANLPSIQPAELAKIGFLVFLAALFSGEKRISSNPLFLAWGVILAGVSFLLGALLGQPLLAGVISLGAVYALYRFGGDAKRLYEGLGVFVATCLAIVGLVAAQPDWGTSMITIFAGFTLFWVAGARIRYLLIAVVGGSALLTPVLLSKQYIADRFTSFLNPSADVLGAGYHVYQSLLAVGSGGFWGLGYGFSRQKYEYLPEAHGDSIFAVISEEVGFFGVSLMLIAFVVFAYRGFRIAYGAQDRFGMLFTSGAVCWVVFQGLLNMMVAVGMLPNTGVPIPFVSYGGSSILSLLIAIGIILNISKTSQYETGRSGGLFQGKMMWRRLRHGRRR